MFNYRVAASSNLYDSIFHLLQYVQNLVEIRILYAPLAPATRPRTDFRKRFRHWRISLLWHLHTHLFLVRFYRIRKWKPCYTDEERVFQVQSAPAKIPIRYALLPSVKKKHIIMLVGWVEGVDSEKGLWYAFILFASERGNGLTSPTDFWKVILYSLH